MEGHEAENMDCRGNCKQFIITRVWKDSGSEVGGRQGVGRDIGKTLGDREDCG